MSHSKMTRRSLLLGIPAVACGISQLASGQEPRGNFREPVYRVSNKSDNRRDNQVVAGEHPLAPALRVAETGLKRIEDNIQDYQCTLVKRERIGGKLLDHEFMDAKIRHNPFSVYLSFKNPASVRGREVLYVEGQNNNNLMAHEGGALLKLVTVNLNPTSSLAMRNQRYPITDIGVKNLVQRLIEVAKEDMQFGECEVKFTNGAKINGRVCTLIEVVHPVPRSNFRFHKAHIFIDDQLQVPVRFASWDWPAQNGGEAPLLEEYTYLDMKVNNGFTDADFDSNNPNYKF
ncbi:MAG: DUF1571 domain-containing protein [Pirellulaceae bacterium]